MLAIDQSSDDTNHQNNKKKISTVQLARKVEMYEARARQLLQEKKEQEDINNKLAAASTAQHNTEISKLKAQHNRIVSGIKRKHDDNSKRMII